MARALTRAVAPDRAPVVTGAWRAGDVRHVFAAPDAAAAGLGFRGDEDFDAGMREFAAAPLRS
jgi:dTDP-L-rhamnose 4-epimerase